MEDKKTIAYLNSKAWYRALKVINLIFVIYCWLLTIGLVVFSFIILFNAGGEFLGLNIFLRILIVIFSILILPILAWLISETPKRIFYYIVLGKIKPEK